MKDASILRRRHFLRLLGGTGICALTPTTFWADGLPPIKEKPRALTARPTMAPSPIVPPEKTFRAMEFEFHSPVESRFDFNVDEIMAAAREAGAESIMLYTQDHWGYAFYPTSVGVRHPRLDYDLVRRMLDSAHRHGLGAIAYYSVHFNNQAVFSHPDWAMRDREGKEWRIPNRWFITCLHTPYGRYVVKMLEEVFSNYPFDALFMDVFGINILEFYLGWVQDPFCYCSYTKALWEKDTGVPYLEGIDTRDGWRARYEWTKKTMLRQPLLQVLELVRRVRPDVRITLNGGPLWLPNDILEKIDYIFAEPIFSSTGISLSSIISRGWKRPNYQSGVWGRAGYQDRFPGQIQRAEADALLVQQARVFLIGGAGVLGILPEGGYAHHWMENAAETYQDVKRVEHLFHDVESVLSVGVLISEMTREYLALEKRPVQFRHSILGALELATYTHYPVEALADWQLRPEVLRNFDLIVLPESEVLSDAAANALREFVRNGGILIASWKSGMIDESGGARSDFALSDVLGVDYVEEVTKYVGDLQKNKIYDQPAIYLQPMDHPLAKSLGSREVGSPGPFVKIRGQAEVVCEYILPALEEDLAKNQWWNWDSPPPGKERAGPAVTCHRFGRGKAVYIGVPIFQVFQEQWYWIQQWLPSLVTQLVPKPLLRFQIDTVPIYAHGSFCWSNGRQRILAQLLNATELALRAELAPLGGATIIGDARRLKLNRATMLYPRHDALPVERHDDEFRIRLPEFGRYTMLALDLTGGKRVVG